MSRSVRGASRVGAGVRRVVAAVVLGLVAALALPAPASADVDDFELASMTVDYTLERGEDGLARMTVVEEFVALFPPFEQNRGMRRAIPDRFAGQPVYPELVSVTDGAGRPRPVEVDEEDGLYVMTSRSDDYLLGRQVFVFTYTLENVTRAYGDTGTELYWNVNGFGWGQPFGEVRARVHLDRELAASVGRDACYRGPDGATERCEIQERGTGTDGALTLVYGARDLRPGENLTFAVGLEDAGFRNVDTSYFGSGVGGWQLGALAGVIGAGALAVGVRSRKLRPAPGRPVVVTEFTPPRQVDALEAAVLLKKTTRAIPAEVLEQAVVGSIRILEEEGKRGKKKLVAELVDPSLADEDGRMLLKGLFPTGRPGDVYRFGKQDTQVSEAAQRILSEAGKALKKRGLYRKVSAWTVAWPILVAVVPLLLLILVSVIGFDNAVSEGWLALGMFAGLGIFLLVALMMIGSAKPLSAEGADVRDHLEGLKRFIAWAEEDRIRMLQSPEGAERMPVDTGDPRQMLHLYERLLPYAVVFGQEKQWSQRLAGLYAQTGDIGPSWYIGAGAFDAAAFSSGIGTLSAAAQSTASSSSGGSTGGGSSGGGGGGGGGGGV